MSNPVISTLTRSFFEAEPRPHLARRALAEAFGTLLLTILVVVAGSAAQSQTGIVGPLAALAPGVVVATALAALIVALGPVSGGHFNPLVTAAQWLRGERHTRCLASYLAAQLCGAVLGAWLARLAMPGTPMATTSTAMLLESEVFATAGLMTIILSLSYAASPGSGLFAVGGWVAMMNVMLPAGPFANPVLAIGLWCAAPGDIMGSSGPMLWHVIAEIAGAGIALAVAAFLYPVIRHH